MMEKLTDDDLQYVVGGIVVNNVGNGNLFDKFIGFVVGKTVEKRFEFKHPEKKNARKYN